MWLNIEGIKNIIGKRYIQYLILTHIDRDSEVLILGPEKVVNQVFYRTI